ncbi:hypothetical protein [Streptomyces sp. OUCMDZ-3434]|uniref:hypothetical protein n=1 Tax=Streptomyces sp. OUCMDZ-3434 TaxID=1535304 RepID=UPI001E608BD3|nr:hypothetical protein [Streptomyces sp. OUCMDZ-3434]
MASSGAPDRPLTLMLGPVPGPRSPGYGVRRNAPPTSRLAGPAATSAQTATATQSSTRDNTSAPTR